MQLRYSAGSKDDTARYAYLLEHKVCNAVRQQLWVIAQDYMGRRLAAPVAIEKSLHPITPQRYLHTAPVRGLYLVGWSAV